jgi:hypothetical protein
MTSRFGALALALALSASGGLIAQSSRLEVVIDDPRPLAKAASELEQRFGWIVTYEDVPYVFAGDRRDVTLEVARVSPTGGRRVIQPNGSPFLLSIEQTPKDPIQSLNEVVRAYMRSGNTGVFRVQAAPPYYHVFPIEFRTERGVSVTQQAVLNSPISLSPGRRTLMRVLEELTGAVATATSKRVVVGTVPINFAMQTQVEGGADNEPARNVLRRILRETGVSLSWQLFSDPSGTFDYVLNLHAVEQPQTQ